MTTFAFVGRTALDMLGTPDKADKIAENAIDKFAEALKNTDHTSEYNTLQTKALLYEMMGDYYNAGLYSGQAYVESVSASTPLNGVKNVGKKLGKNGVGGAGNAKTDGKTNTKNPETTLNAKGELVDKSGDSSRLEIQNISWTNHGYKHVAPSGANWKDVVKSTKSGPAKYLPNTNIEKLERSVWENGLKVTNGKNWKVMKFDNTIGASEGKETKFMRVEMSGGTIHGHPITEQEYNKLTK